MTDAELEGVSAQALNMAKLDIERKRFNFLLASYHVTDIPPLHRMKTIEAFIVAKLGREWLNSGLTKDIGFRLLRQATDILPPDALVIVLAANRFHSTEKFKLLPESRQAELLHGGHDCHHQAVKDGLLTVVDSLFAIAQTPRRVCQLIQDMDHGQPLGKPVTTFCPQEGFGGRLKMFGEDRYDSRRSN